MLPASNHVLLLIWGEHIYHYSHTIIIHIIVLDDVYTTECTTIVYIKETAAHTHLGRTHISLLSHDNDIYNRTRRYIYNIVCYTCVYERERSPYASGE